MGVVEAEPPRVAPLSISEIERLIHLYVPEDEAEAILRELLAGKTPPELTLPDLLDLRIRLERVLAASLGGAAAHYIIEDRFTISKGEARELVESFQAIQRSLRTSEHLLASVVESVEDCIFTTDPAGRWSRINPAGQALLGLSAAETSGLTYLDVLDARGAAAGGRRHRARAGRSGDRGGARSPDSRGTGQRFPAHLSIACVFDAQREVIGTVGVLRDLTEQVATQQRLIQREKLASLGEMAAGVAHEIRNPLGGIKMATTLLTSGAVDGGAISREMAHTILSGIAEIDTIISDLLDYARDTRLDRQEYPVGRILASVVDGIDAEATRRGVELVTGGLDRDVVALVDGQRLRQAITNVVRNALEAVERRPGPRVEVRLYPRGSAAVVEVADNGSGIVPEHREKLFLPFFTTKPTGTGLGMAIVKKIMDLHGGEIEIDSAPGHGTTVRLVIPHARRRTGRCDDCPEGGRAESPRP